MKRPGLLIVEACLKISKRLSYIRNRHIYQINVKSHDTLTSLLFINNQRLCTTEYRSSSMPNNDDYMCIIMINVLKVIRSFKVRDKNTLLKWKIENYSLWVNFTHLLDLVWWCHHKTFFYILEILLKWK